MARSKCLGFAAINKVSRHIVFNETMGINGRLVPNIVNNGTVRRAASRRENGLPSIRSVCVSVNTDLGGRTLSRISLNSTICFSSYCHRFNSNFVGTGTVSSHINYRVLLELVGSSLPCSTAFYFSIRRRVNAHKTTTTTCSITPSFTVIIRNAATTSVSNIPSRGGIYHLNNNTIIDFVSEKAICSDRLCGGTFRVTRGGNVKYRAGAIITNNGGTSTVRGTTNNVGALTMSIPYECVRSNDSITGGRSVRDAFRLMGTLFTRLSRY